MSEAVAQSATTLARQEKEKLRQALLKGKSDQAKPVIGGAGAAADRIQEASVLLNRRTGQPVYSPQPVMSSAHIFRECKKSGIPMPKAKVQSSATPSMKVSSLVAPAVLIVAVGVAVTFGASEAATSIAEPLTAASSLPTLTISEGYHGGKALALSTKSNLVNDPYGVTSAELDIENERLSILQQQPLWLQRQR